MLERFFGDGEHAAGAHRAVVETVGSRGDRFSHGFEHEPGHQAHRITGRPVLTSFLVVLFVEAAHQLLEHRTHAVVVETRG